MDTLNTFNVLQGYHVEVDFASGCWNYTGKQKARYPRVSFNGVKYSLHRLSWMLANEKSIPEEMYVCHKCDNTKCCNPDHLFLGTQFDNMQDMIQKGRNANTKGDNNPRAALTEGEVIEIRNLYVSGWSRKDLSRHFSTPPSTISNILRGDTWGHLEYTDPKRMPANKRLTKDTEQRIKQLHSTQKISQVKIAKIVGISQAVVSRVLLGEATGW